MRNAREWRVSAKNVRRWIDSAAGGRTIMQAAENARKTSEVFISASIVPQSSPVIARGPNKTGGRGKS